MECSVEHTMWLAESDQSLTVGNVGLGEDNSNDLLIIPLNLKGFLEITLVIFFQ